MPVAASYKPSQLHRSLGPSFFDPVQAANFPATLLRYRNQQSAESVGLDALTDEEWLRHFGRFEALPDNLPEPLALRYHGHQFGSYNPQLGDGRGFLFAQLYDQQGRLLDLGTKGSGTTPYSRGGDGRLTLKGGVREALCTELLESLGVNTSKTLSLVETGEALMRNDEPSPTRSCVLVRLSHSHVRFGTFQRLLAHRQKPELEQLLEYCVQQYLPEAQSGEGSLAIRFLRAVLQRTAELCASYMAAGFVHGVLNTDNMNVTGESFDYGPYRFLPRYEPNFVAAYFDHGARYAYGKQPDVMHWNVVRLAETLTLVEDVKELEVVINEFDASFWPRFFARFLTRLGVESRGHDEDSALFEAAIAFMEQSRVGFDDFFFDWYGGRMRERQALASARAALYAGPSFDNFRRRLDEHAPVAPDRLSHPYFARDAPCTLVIEEVEAVFAPIARDDDWSAFEAKIADLRVVGEALGQRTPAPASGP